MSLAKNAAKAGKGRFIPIKGGVGPVSTLDMGKFGMLRPVSVRERRQQLNVLSKITSFNDLRLTKPLRASISAWLHDMPPTPVQKVAIKVLSRPLKVAQQATLIAAETGSGKTLAYLAPMLTNLSQTSHTKEGITETDNAIEPQTTSEITDFSAQNKSENLNPTNTNADERKNAIRGIVLVPTLELAEQVFSTAHKLAPDLKIARFAGPTDFVEKMHSDVEHGVDLVIATPAKLLKLLKNYFTTSKQALSKCDFVVIDEADTLANPSFVAEMTGVLDRCRNARNVVFVTATIPRAFDRYLRSEYPTIQRLVTPSIHRLPRHIEFRVIEAWRAPYHNDKDLALRQLLYAVYNDNTEPSRVKRAVVFVNKRESVEHVVDVLNSTGFSATSLLASKQEERAAILAQFVNSDVLKEGKLQILVATDVAARGVDFQDLKNVVLYDVPFTAADLLHRAGRTGRLGKKGRVFVLASQKESKGWLKGLETVVKRGMALA